jgi:hypothetical protein
LQSPPRRYLRRRTQADWIALLHRFGVTSLCEALMSKGMKAIHVRIVIGGVILLLAAAAWWFQASSFGAR